MLTEPGGAPAPSSVFADIGTSVHAANILQLAELGITGGCAAGLYCPEDPVTRAQMATFLVRALDLPAHDDDTFDDDNGSVHEANIQALANAQITLGCGDRTYCPNDPVTRAQMATFLIRALDAGLASRPAGPLVPDAGVLVGAAVDGVFADYETALGRSMDIGHVAAGVDDSVDATVLADHVAAGRVPMLTWTPGTVAEALAGDLHTEIDLAAAYLAGLDSPVFLRYWPGLDAAVADPDEAEAIWAEAQSSFEAAGASNVIWVWSPAVIDPAAVPGPFDWVGVSAYGDLLDAAAELGDYPIMVAEWGAAPSEGDPEAQVNFVNSIGPVLDAHPTVAALVAMEATGDCDWRVTPNPDAVSALTDLITPLTVDLDSLLAGA